MIDHEAMKHIMKISAESLSPDDYDSLVDIFLHLEETRDSIPPGTMLHISSELIDESWATDTAT